MRVDIFKETTTDYDVSFSMCSNLDACLKSVNIQGSRPCSARQEQESSDESVKNVAALA